MAADTDDPTCAPADEPGGAGPESGHDALHDALREDLALHATGDLDPAEAARVEEHLATCVECRRELAGLRATAAAVTRAGGLAPGAANTDLAGFYEGRVAPALARASGARGWTRLARAAAVVLAFAGGIAAERYALGPGRLSGSGEPAGGAARFASGHADSAVSDRVASTGFTEPSPGTAGPADSPLRERVVASYGGAGRAGSSDLGRTLIALAALSEVEDR